MELGATRYGGRIQNQGCRSLILRPASILANDRGRDLPIDVRFHGQNFDDLTVAVAPRPRDYGSKNILFSEPWHE
jgi:hypothetical protein